MGITDEQKDKSGKSKPPLLPKPCVASSLAGPGEHVIPQMIITSPDDITEEVETAATKDELVIAVPVSETTDVVTGIKETADVEDAAQKQTAMQRPLTMSSDEISTEEQLQNESQIHQDDAMHSAVQRPLVIESEKTISMHQDLRTEDSGPNVPVQAPTASQRPLIFDGSKPHVEIQPDPVAVEEEEETEAELQLVFNASEKAKDEVSPSIEDSISPENKKKCQDKEMKTRPSSFLKKHGFPSFHFGGKDSATSSEAHTENINVQSDLHKEDKKQPKEGQHSVKHFFTSLIHEPKEEKSEKPLELESSNEEPKDLKHGVKKFFDSFKSDTAEQPSQKSKSLKQSHELNESEKPSKDEHTEGKSCVRSFIESFKHETVETHEDKASPQHEHEKILDETKQEKEEKHNVKKFFDSFKHEGEPKIKSDECAEPQKSKGEKEPNATTKEEQQLDIKHTVKKFFDSFKHDVTEDEKCKVNEQQKKLESGLKEPQKDSKHSLKTFFESFKHEPTEEEKEKLNKKHQQTELEGVIKEPQKESKTGVKKLFDSFSNKELGRQEEHIYDDVGGSDASPQTDLSSKEMDHSKEDSKKQKEGHHGVKKLFDSFRLKDSQKPIIVVKKKAENENEIKMSENVDTPHAKVHFERMEPTRTEIASQDAKVDPVSEKETIVKEPKKEGSHGFKQLFGSFKEKDSSKAKSKEYEVSSVQQIHDVPDNQIVDSSVTTEDTKPSIFSSLKPKFMSKDKSHFKDANYSEKDQKDESRIQEYDLQKAGPSDEFPEHVAGTFKPLGDFALTSQSTLEKKQVAAQSNKPEDARIAPHASVEVNGYDVSEPEPQIQPKKIPKSKEPGTPESLYETCCVRLAVLLRNKAFDIVAEHTKSPPKKPPKPSAEAIARARAAAVEKRVQDLQQRRLNFGDDIPVGINGIRYADDETESSGDYKDVDNFDYIMDYELVNRYKFDNKFDTFSVPSTCSGMTSYYTADTATLKDENFSDAALETVSLGSSDSYLFKHLSFVQAKSDLSLEPSPKGYTKSEQLSKSAVTPTKGKDIPTSTEKSGVKKKPPPLPPKPTIVPKSTTAKSSTQKSLPEVKVGEISRCVNSLSLSPRLSVKGKGDSAGTQKRPLTIAGVKETEFSSLRKTKLKGEKISLKDRKFDTVLKNESLKNIPTISSGHLPLTATKSSPPQLELTRSSPDLSLTRKISPQRPPPPFSRTTLIDNKQQSMDSGITLPKPPVKPKRDSATASPSIQKEKRTVSPPRPPPPAVKTPVRSPPPPRPPPPVKASISLASHVSKETTAISDVDKSEPLDSHGKGDDSTVTEVDMKSTLKQEDELSKLDVTDKSEATKSASSTDINELDEQHSTTPIITAARGDKISTAGILTEESTSKDGMLPVETVSFECLIEETHPPERSTCTSEIQIKPPMRKPKAPPRTRRVRSRTVEVVPSEKIVEPRKRRSQSLSDVEDDKKASSIDRLPASDKAELKALYTAVNKNGKRGNLVVDGDINREVRSSSLEKVPGRPLPAPPPPPRKFRSLGHKPKGKTKVTENIDFRTDSKCEDEMTEISLNDSQVRPPVRKRKGEKQRFHSLGRGDTNKDAEPELNEETVSISPPSSVPFRPERHHHKRHIEPSYDENANVSFPVVAEVHYSEPKLDECGNEILDTTSNQNIPCTTQSDIAIERIEDEAISAHPRKQKSSSVKDAKTRSSWYDETDTSSPKPVEASWEILDWNPGEVIEVKHPSNRKLRRRSDPIKKTQPASKFYVGVQDDIVSAPLVVDKETSPLHLDCSEKSVQTSLETLSHGIASRDEQSDDTDELLDLAQTLQNELKIIINRHKSTSEYNESEEDSRTPPLSVGDKDKLSSPDKKVRKDDSIRSSTSELWQMTSSEESDGDLAHGGSANLTEIALTRKQKKIFYVAQEIVTSEEMFVDALKLLNVDFKAAVENANKQRNTNVIPDETLCQILNHLPQLLHLNENLLMELKDRIENWEKVGKIADIIVKMGPFLKLYSWFIHDFESTIALMEDSKKKYPLFAQVVSEFERSSRCKRLTLNHFLLKPIQRIPQYRLLLQEYLHHLPEDSPDHQDTVTALQIVSEVATHANDSMKQGDNVQKLFSIQNSILGHKEIIKPGRVFIKEGELMKLSRKGMQPRWFVLLNDLLLYLTPVQQGLYRVNHELALTGMKVAIPIQQDYQNEFSIISVTRSFTLASRSPEERQEWIIALTKAIEENASKRSTFTNVRLQQRAQNKTSEEEEETFVLGRKAPVWIPDARVTMCQLCTSEFTVTFRRHHCRACGKVVCSICSSNRISLPYLGNRIARVCDECHIKIGPGSGGCTESGETDSDNQQIAIKSHLRTDRHIKKGKRNLPSVLKEVCANDQGSTISGYLQIRSGKNWRRDWFVVKDKVLYEYKASEDVAALRSVPLLGYQIESFNETYEGVDSSILFKLTHPGQPPIIFYADTVGSMERWVAVLKEASVLE